MIWNPSRVCQHLVSQVDQHLGWVIIRSGQKTEPEQKDRNAEHTHKG
jgi:hypothetical protein